MERILDQLDRYNVRWTTPGRTDRGSMPVGNGEVALNVWVERDGDLQFYIARTDALTELDRNVKLGKVRVRLAPNPFRDGAPFLQELRLRDGLIVIEAGEGPDRGVLGVFVDAESPAVYVTGEFAAPVRVTAVYETWRTRERPPRGDSPLGDRSEFGIVESPDVVTLDGDRVIFYHRNGETCVRVHAEQQGLAGDLDRIPDPLAHRTFGGVMAMPGARAAGAGRLEKEADTAFELVITTHSAQAARLEDWLLELDAIRAGLPDAQTARARTARWWNAYWTRSWIFVEGDKPGTVRTEAKLAELAKEPFPEPPEPPSHVTRAYVLTKWMTACAARGAFPILFNGSLFNVMPGGSQHYSTDRFDNFPEVFTSMPDGEPDLEFNPDERAWTHMNLWQNVRLPYLSMPARGEADMMLPLFRYYRRFRDLNRLRARLYFRSEGQFNTEITTSFGLYPGWVFGFDREGLPAHQPENRYGGAVEISPGLELVKMMLDYYEYTSDDRFLREEALPYAKELFRFIETRYARRENGKIVLEPIHAVETFWDTRDSMPVVAGMHAVLNRILALPADKVPDREYFDAVRAITPDLPTRTVSGRKVFAPAGVYEPLRRNIELPELYAVHPFELYRVNKPDLSLAVDSFRHAMEETGAFRPYVMGRGPVDGQYYASYSGWQQIGMIAALLGLAEEAKTVLADNCRLNNPGFRFPAMWGPIYDAVPDNDHGANILATLQLMAFQTDGDRILVLPAWPREWNVWFKFHAPGRTTVECEYRDGRVTKLDVQPPERRKDVKVFQPK